MHFSCSGAWVVQVTDDLFDEIAQEVMDEDEQRLLEGLVSCLLLL